MEKKGLNDEGNKKYKNVIVILEQASLETVKTSKGYQLLNADDHRGIHKKYNKDPTASRPDILHQELMALLDSPLNKAGLLQVYIKTLKGVLIEVNPSLRVPRTYKRFAGLMIQLLHALKIRSSDGNVTLLKVIKNPIINHLPPGAKRYCLSTSGRLVNPWDFTASLPSNESVVFIIGAMAHGHLFKDNVPYLEESFSISEYPLSGAQAISRILNGFEKHLGIL